jgi:hypothetical protein
LRVEVVLDVAEILDAKGIQQLLGVSPRSWFICSAPPLKVVNEATIAAPVSLPLWPGSSTISPSQAASCAAAPGVKVVAARRPAARTAASTDAHTFKKVAFAIPPSNRARGRSSPPHVT